MSRVILVLVFGLEAIIAAQAPQGRQLVLEPYFRDLKVVHATAAGRVLTLLVDTGGGATAISPEAAAGAGCAPHGRDVGHRMTGDAVVFAQCEAFTLTVGSWSRSFAPIGVFDIAALLPKELPHLDGVLALDAFGGEVVTIDWRAGTLTVVRPGTEKAALAAHGLPVRPATGETGRFLSAYVPVRGTTGLLWFLLDSGNLRGTLVSRDVIEGQLLPLAGEGQARLAIGARPAITLPFTVDSLAIDGAFGTDFLNRGPVTLDLRRSPPQ